MDTPADLATPFAEVYQSFLDDLVLHGTKASTIHRYRYKWGEETSSNLDMRDSQAGQRSPAGRSAKGCRRSLRTRVRGGGRSRPGILFVQRSLR
jgi:hypothetical protein